MSRILAAFFAIVTVAPCPAPSAGAWADPIADCHAYGAVEVTGRVTIDGINEVSGVVASRSHPGVLWIEEDSGNPETIYAIATTGAELATVDVASADNRDWEDIALAGHRLWLGDIGDNAAQRSSIRAYWFHEPPLSATSVAAHLLTLTYDDGRARNAEALMVDPDRKKLFVITKAQGSALVFRTSVARLHGAEAAVLHRIAELPLSEVTAADLGPRGIVVKSGDGYRYRWSHDHRIGTTLSRTPCRAQTGPGESLAFSSDDRAFYAIPEGRSPSVYRTPPA